MRADRPACLLFLALALGYAIAGAAWSLGAERPLAPDTIDYAVAGRSLAEGRGYVVDFRAYHAGLRSGIAHTPEAHGILRAFVLAPLFAAFGAEDGMLGVPGFCYVALTALGAFLLTRSIAGYATGWVAGLLTLSSGPLFVSAAAGFDDAGFACFSFVSLALLHRGVEARKHRFLLFSGVAAGFAVLEKLTGAILGPIAAVVVGLAFARDRKLMARAIAAWLPPYLLGLGAYSARSLAASGSLAPQMGPLEWIWKTEGFEGLFALFPSTPTWSDVHDRLGTWGMLAVPLEQLELLLRAAFQWSPWHLGAGLAGPPWLFLTGAVCALVLLRSPLGAIAALTWAGTIALVAGLYHIEMRYFNGLIPLTSVAVALVIARAGGVRAGSPLGAPGLRRRLTAVVAVALCAASALAGATTWSAADGRAGQRPPTPCRDAYAWLQANASADEGVLAMFPSAVAWYARRPAVIVPSGGALPIRRVVAHYDLRWLLLEPASHRPEAVRSVHSLITTRDAKLVFRGARCSVARLRG